MDIKSLYSQPFTICHKPTSYAQINALAAELGALNMSSGYPNWDPPKFLRDLLTEATEKGENQYTICKGHPDMLEAIAKVYSKRFNRELDPKTEVTAGNGGTSLLLQALSSYK